ncbi:MAG: hypothetical protein ACP6IS_00125 [Candidatus Asgardarchaeia archaeon]
MIYSVLLVQERGTLILWEDLQKIKIPLDKTLIAGMLSALISVSEEVFGSNFRKIEFQNLELTFYKLPESHVMLGVVSDQGDPNVKIFITNLSPQLEEFFKAHPRLIEGSYLPSTELNELSEMIKSQSVRILMPKFSEVRHILENLYFELLNTKLMDETAEISYKIELEKEEILRKISSFDSIVRDALKRERPRDSRNDLREIVKEIYRGNIAEVVPLLPKYFDLGLYGHIAKLLFVKVGLFSRLFVSLNEVPSAAVLNETLDSVETKKEILLYIKSILSHQLSILSDEPSKPVISNYSLKAIEHEIIARFDEISDPLIKDLYAIAVVPLQYNLPTLLMRLAEYFKDKSKALEEWCMFLHDVYELRRYIYARSSPQKVKQSFSIYKEQYLESYNELKSKQQLIDSLTMDKIRSLHPEKQVSMKTTLFIHFLRYTKFLYALIATTSASGFSLSEIEENMKLFRDTLEFEKTLISKFIDLTSILVTFYLASAVLTLLWISNAYFPHDDYLEFLESNQNILNLFLDKLFTSNATRRISESMMILNGLEVFDYISKYFSILNRVNPYQIILLEYLKSLEPDKIDNIKTHDFSTYLLVMSFVSHILGYNTFLIKRTIDRVRGLQTIITIQEPIIHMYLMSGWVHPDLYISILDYHRKIIETVYEPKVALDNFYLAMEKARVLLEYPSISSFSKVRILNLLIDSFLAAIQKQEQIPEGLPEEGFKLFDETIYIYEHEQGNEQKVAELVRKRVFLTKFLEDRHKTELIETD